MADDTQQRVRAELIAREPLFHRPEFGTRRADFAAMMADDFWEIGASGRRYTREYVLDVLAQRHRREFEDPWEVSDFHCQPLGASLYLASYTLIQGQRVTRRATLWDNWTGQWKARFHQGTVVSDVASEGN